MNERTIRGKFVVGVTCSLLALTAATAAEVPRDKLTSEGDVLSSPPTRATAAGIPACAAAEKWATYISAQDLEKVVSLYAHDAIILTPEPGNFARGSDEIRKFIGRAMATAKANQPAEEVPVQFMGSGNECFHVMAFKFGTMTHFEVFDVHHTVVGDDGKIIRDTMYSRPGLSERMRAGMMVK